MGYGFTVLIGKREISNRMILADVLNCCVDQFRIYVRWVEDGQGFLGFQSKIKQRNHNDGKDQQSPKEFSIGIEKGFHKNNFGKSTKSEFYKRGFAFTFSLSESNN